MSNRHPVTVALEWMWRGMGKPKPIRRMLTYDDFYALVRGEEITQNGVTIALADIGCHEMSLAIEAAHHRQMGREI